MGIEKKTLDSQKTPSAADKKIAEYTARILSGESKDAVLKDLPGSFTGAVEAKLAAEAAENEELLKQMHMKDRPMRVDENTAEYMEERRESWQRQEAENQSRIVELRRELGIESAPGAEESSPLTVDEIQGLLKTLPRVPVAEGSRLTMIDPNILKPKTADDVPVGSVVFQSDVVGEVVSKSGKGELTLRLSDGATRSIMPSFGETYSVSDIEKLRGKQST